MASWGPNIRNRYMLCMCGEEKVGRGRVGCEGVGGRIIELNPDALPV